MELPGEMTLPVDWKSVQVKVQVQVQVQVQVADMPVIALSIIYRAI